jgi:hypothetical protein
MEEKKDEIVALSKVVIEKHAEDCPILNVVVYRDRAEVTRSAVLTTDEIGETQVVIDSLTKYSNTDSFRVKTMDSNCDILEVSHEKSFSKKSTVNQTLVDEVKKKVDELEDDLKQCESKITRSTASKDLIKNFADNALANNSKAPTRVSISEAKEIIDYYQNEALKLDDELFVLKKDKNLIETELAVQKKKLLELTNGSNASNETTLSLFVTLNIKAAGEIHLQFSYVVTCATWSPSYDIRVNNSDNSLALSYFAEVTQTTGENWKDCELFLSTSNPSMGSSPPPLPTKTVDFSYNNYSYAKQPMMKRESKAAMFGGLSNNTFRERAGSFSLMDEYGGGGGGGSMPMSFQTQMPSEFVKAGVVGTGDLGSTVFTIPRKVTIDCDNKPHKVMITARSFKPQMVHYAVPSVSPNVYIQAKTKNNSPYPLLASDNVSIYLDGNFVSKSSLPQTNAGESFQVFIGVDQSVKLEYLPVRNEEYRKGWVQGTEVKKVSHTTILHNSKSQMIRIILAECLPRSTNDKIVVELVEPAPNTLTEGKSSGIQETSAQDVLSNLSNYGTTPAPATAEGGGNNNNNNNNAEDSLPKDFVAKNKNTNNIVWLKTLQPQEKIQINFTYRLTWPQGSQIAEY